MKVYLASDHAGFELKEKIKQWLKEWEYEAEDLGPHKYDPDDDYPELIKPAALKVAEDPEKNRAIVMGGSGQGEAMTCNAFGDKGVRAAVYYARDLDILNWMREHNNANALSLAARKLSDEDAKEAVKIFLEVPFPGEEKHKRRIGQLKHLRD